MLSCLIIIVFEITFWRLPVLYLKLVPLLIWSHHRFNWLDIVNRAVMICISVPLLVISSEKILSDLPVIFFMILVWILAGIVKIRPALTLMFSQLNRIIDLMVAGILNILPASQLMFLRLNNILGWIINGFMMIFQTNMLPVFLRLNHILGWMLDGFLMIAPALFLMFSLLYRILD